MKDFITSPFVEQMKKTALDMYRLGWDERNSGNISLLLDTDEASEYLDLNNILRSFNIDFDASALAGRIFLVTGTGKYFKNIYDDPETNLGVIRIADDGHTVQLLWGYKDGGSFTSELAAHLMSHAERLLVDGSNRVVMHCHPANIVAMTHVHELNEKAFTHTLWQMCTESILVFPDGVGLLPWMVCGTDEIGRATADKMRDFRIVIWAMHGIYAVGSALDEAFGLVETVDKAAQVYMLTAHLNRINSIKDSELASLAQHFGLNYRKDFLEL